MSETTKEEREWVRESWWIREHSPVAIALLKDLEEALKLVAASSHFDFEWGDAYARGDEEGRWEIRHNRDGAFWVANREEAMAKIAEYNHV